MASIERTPSDIPSISDPPSFSASDKTSEQAMRRALEQFRKILAELSSRMNGLLSLGTPANGRWTGNLDGQWSTGLEFKGTDELAVPHGLKRVPVAVLPVITSDMTTGASDEATIYASPDHAWTQDMVFLKKTGAGNRKITLLIL
jgi:hypothetical protein